MERALCTEEPILREDHVKGYLKMEELLGATSN